MLCFSFVKYKLYICLKIITLIVDDDDDNTSYKLNSFDTTNIDENSIEDSCKYYNLICVLFMSFLDVWIFLNLEFDQHYYLFCQYTNQFENELRIQYTLGSSEF